MPSIRRDIPIPIYYQLKQLITEQIDEGSLEPGDQLPSEDKLCTLYGISRTPVRQALTELVHEGVLVRMHGRGTFVAKAVSAPETASGTKLRIVLSDERWREPLEGAALLWRAVRPDDSLDLEFQTVPLRELHSTLIDAVGRGEAPDISVLDSVWVAEFAHQHYLYALDEVDPAWLQISVETFFPAILAANRYQGHLYGMPISADVSVLWYRRDWLAAEGLAPPATWEELVAVGRHFREPEVRARYCLGLHPLVFVGGRRGGETTTFQCLPFLWAVGGNLIANGRVALDSPQGRRPLAFLRALVHEHRLAPPEVVDYAWDQAAHLFGSGEAALALGGTHDGFFIRQAAGWDEAAFQERVGFALIPAGPGGQPTTLAGGMSYVLYRQSRSPEQALALLELSGQPEVLKPFCVATGQIPPRVSVARMLSSTGDGFLARTIPLLERARARPAIPEYARVSKQFQVLIEDCLAGRRPIDEAVSLAAERISAITGLPSG
jgi:ABC-type glycerol-3-phosphate transport system substrate-binding protein